MNGRAFTASIATLGLAMGLVTYVTTRPEPAPGLDGLRVADPVTAPGYHRDQFGPAWYDVDGNGCSTRQDVLRRDLTDDVPEAGCRITAGRLTDPYTGRVITWTSANIGTKDPNAVDIDHVVSLKDAWSAGAWAWTARQRRQFANDPGNLLATQAAVNRSKGEDTAAEWSPPTAAGRCRYARTVVRVKTQWQLTVVQAERDALARMLGDCR